MDDDRTLAELADQPLDDVDAATLDAGRARCTTRSTRCPTTSSSGSSFSLALDEMYDEVARMTRVPLDAHGGAGRASRRAPAPRR